MSPRPLPHGVRRLRDAARTLGALDLLLLAAPVNLGLTGAALLRGRLQGRQRGADRHSNAERPRTIMISGGKMTKALQLARSFHGAGHRVVLVETAKYRFAGHRFSHAVDVFRLVPEPRDPGYTEALVRIVREEAVDVYVPVCSPLSSRYDALAKQALSAHCEVLHVGPATLDRLDDKYLFSRAAHALDLAVPDTHRITDPQQVLDHDFTGARRPYVLKSIAYDPVHRLDLTLLPRPTREQTAAFVSSLPITEDNPWILQEFIAGTEYCTHSTVREGRVQVWCCCESSAFQVNYANLDKPEIRAWVERFVGALKITGQVAFDFIETQRGELFAIECNPRTHSAITMLAGHPGVAAAYLETGGPVVEPRPGSRPTYWIYQEAWRLLTQPRRWRANWRVIREGKDAIFDWDDPLPFLAVHHLQIPWLLLENLRRPGSWIRIDFNIGKLVEPAGD